MANTDAAYGFTPRSQPGGGDPLINSRAPQGYSIASAYGTSLFRGDPVKSSGTADTVGRPGIVIAPAGAVRGVFQGCEYTNAQGERVFSPYWPASTVATDIIAHVADDPDTIFSIQADEDVVAADVGQQGDFVSGTGDTSTGLSAYELDSSDIGTGDAVHILGLDGTFAVNDFGNYAKVLVQFNEHELGGGLTEV